MADRVRTSVRQAARLDSLDHVSVDVDRLDAFARRLRTREFPYPDWRAPVLVDESEYGVETVFDFFLVGNSLNFAFDDVATGETFETTYAGESWIGGYALWASLTRAMERGIDITDGAVLRELTLDQTRTILSGTRPIPLLEERHRILTNLGTRLCERLDGHFHSEFAPESDHHSYDDGRGIIEFLTREFPGAYADTREYDGQTVYFDKEAKLSVGMVQGRFHDSPEYTIADCEEMTLFADYLIPALLRDEGVFEYSDELTRAVDSRRLLPEGSQMEVEIRIATILTGERLLDRINSSRSDPIDGLHLDQALWRMGRNRDLVHHFTETTTY
jgi:hypothetical protein